jgi:putative FmdB family regulatory protein
MPIYEYVCMECGNKNELIRKSTDIVVCPDCNVCMVRQLSYPACIKFGDSTPRNELSNETGESA